MDKKSMFSLEGKIALVTGGAHGIGFAIAESYAEAGATVVFNCSNEESLKRGLAAYKEKGIDAHGYVCDVTDEEAVKKMIADIEEIIFLGWGTKRRGGCWNAYCHHYQPVFYCRRQ